MHLTSRLKIIYNTLFLLFQHFPLYRESDKNCNEPDEAPEDLKKMKFRERWDCLSQEATSMVRAYNSTMWSPNTLSFMRFFI